jgi:hypothetical protein
MLAQLPEYPDAPFGIIAPDYFRRLIARSRIAPGPRWLDVRSPETQEHVRRKLAREIAVLGLGERFVLGDLIARDHQLTRIIAGWAIDEGFDGIAYASCHDPSLTCWAVFEGVEVIPIGTPMPITPSDPDLAAVAQLWNLKLP